MITLPDQSSVAMAYKQFDDAGRMRPSSYCDRIVDVMEELVRFTILIRPHAGQLVNRYSEHKASGSKIDPSAQRANAALADGKWRPQSGHAVSSVPKSPFVYPETGWPLWGG